MNALLVAALRLIEPGETATLIERCTPVATPPCTAWGASTRRMRSTGRSRGCLPARSDVPMRRRCRCAACPPEPLCGGARVGSGVAARAGRHREEGVRALIESAGAEVGDVGVESGGHGRDLGLGQPGDAERLDQLLHPRRLGHHRVRRLAGNHRPGRATTGASLFSPHARWSTSDCAVVVRSAISTVRCASNVLVG